jgi:hypothetical protein
MTHERTPEVRPRSRASRGSARQLAAAALLALSAGCYRTVYTGFATPGTAAPTITQPAPRSSSWRSFYLYGYLPAELVVDAAAECGGADRVREIRTRQSFSQGLVSMFATSSGVNAYAPWTGEVVCIEDP